MKKKLLLITSLLVSSINIAQTTFVPDDAFESRLIQLGLDSGPLDNFVLTANISSLENLNLSNSILTDITGLQDFTSLKDLRVSGPVTDLSPIENLANLEELAISRVTSTSLDLTAFVNLEFIYITDTALTSLDFSNNSNLLEASIETSDVNELILSNNPLLDDLYIIDLDISELDLSSCTALYNLSVVNCDFLINTNLTQNTITEFVVFNDNPLLTFLDLSANTALSRVEARDNATLETVYIKNGNNTNIGQTFIVRNNPLLTCVEVDDVAWSATSWGFNTNYFTGFSLNCGGFINIPDPNFEQALIDQNIDSDGTINAQVLASDIENITYLDVNSENISDLTGIEGFTALETLLAYNNNLSTVNVSANTQLSGLVLAINNLTGLDVSNNINLVSLSLNENVISSIDLSNNINLTQFYIDDNKLSEIDLSSLMGLEELSIANNNLTSLQVEKNTALRIINCASNQISELNTLSNISLENLNCEQNSIEYLNLSQNTLLTKLTCNDNALKGLNIKNGANTNISNQDFTAFANYNLSCIEVDDENYSNSNWAQIEMSTSFSLNCTPVNDDCSYTIPIILGQDTPGNTSSASGSLNSPNCSQSGIVVYDVWYSFPAPATGSVTLTLNAQPLIGKVALYSSCSDTQPLYCAENELIVNGLTPNATYYVQVWLELSGTGKASGVTKQLNANGAFVFNVSDSSTLSTTTFNNNLDDISLWPNPAYNTLNITSKNTINSVEVFNVSGQKIIEKAQINSANYTLDVSKLNSGFYFVKTSGSVNNSVKKVLIK